MDLCSYLVHSFNITLNAVVKFTVLAKLNLSFKLTSGTFQTFYNKIIIAVIEKNVSIIVAFWAVRGSERGAVFLDCAPLAVMVGREIPRCTAERRQTTSRRHLGRLMTPGLFSMGYRKTD